MRIIGLGGFANVRKTTILKGLINDLKRHDFNLQSSSIDPRSHDDLYAIFKNINNEDIIFIATGGDDAAHVSDNIKEARKKGAKTLVTPYRISRNDDVQDIIKCDSKAILISKPKYPIESSLIESMYVKRLRSAIDALK